MSVLVKGMKMPEACFWRDKNGSLTICPLCDTDGYCGANGKQRCLVPENEMPNDCPLIELHPHGRLIDADALENKEYNLIRYVYRDGYTAVQQVALSAVPTILEAEVEEE